MKKIKVLLVDDHAVVRMGLKYALSLFKDIELAGELSDGERAAELMKSSGADVALLDIRMPGKDGLAALGEMLAADPSAKVVMLTTSSMEEDVYAALNAGAKGYVLKDRNPENIVKAVRTVAEGGTFIPDDIKAMIDEPKFQFTPVHLVNDSRIVSIMQSPLTFTLADLKAHCPPLFNLLEALCAGVRGIGKKIMGKR